jgi:hypothetical protein
VNRKAPQIALLDRGTAVGPFVLRMRRGLVSRRWCVVARVLARTSRSVCL